MTVDAFAPLLLKLLHIASSSVFMAAFILFPLLKIAADRTKDARIIAFTHDRLWRVGPAIIGISALILFASGYILLRAYWGKVGGHPFALWGLILLFAALGVWHFAMRPLETRMANLADEAQENGTELPPSFQSASGSWLLANTGALVLIFAALWLMVFKPWG